MLSFSPASRHAAHQAALVDLLRSERQLQRALAHQQRLLQQISDATAQLFALWRMQAEGREQENNGGGLWRFYSLHELLLSAAQQQQQSGSGVPPGLSRSLNARLLDCHGLPPAHPLLFGSCDAAASQPLLLRAMRPWLKQLAEAMPLLCCCNQINSNGAAEVGVKRERTCRGDAAQHNHNIINSPSGGGDDAATPEQKSKRTRHCGDDDGEDDDDDGGGSEEAATTPQAARQPQQSTTPPLPLPLPLPFASPLLSLADGGARFTAACQATARLLAFLRLMLTATSDPIATTTDNGIGNGRGNGGSLSHAHTDPRAYHHHQNNGPAASCLADGALPPLLLALLRGGNGAAGWELRPLLRFMLVDLLEIADTLCEEALHRQRHPGLLIITTTAATAITGAAASRNTAGAGSSSGGGGAYEEDDDNEEQRRPAATTVAAVAAPPAYRPRIVGGGGGSSNTLPPMGAAWPSVAEVALLAREAEALAAALRDCLQVQM